MDLKVLHLIDTLKPNSIPWFYNLIDNIPETETFLSAWNTYYRPPKHKLIPFYLKESQTTGIAVELLNMLIRYYRKVFYPGSIAKYASEVDIVHCHFAHVGWENLKFKKLIDVPYFVSFYGYDYESIPFKYPEWKAKYLNLFQEADVILAEGPFGGQKLVDMGCPKHKVKISKLGVNTNQIPFYNRQKLSGELNLLQIAAFREKKGQYFAIQAFLSALEDCPNMTLTMVGEDQDNRTDYFKSTIPKEHIKKVRFIDRMDFSRIYEFMSNYHVFIHPSCYSGDRDCEGGAPIVLLDAQATGMPIISTKHCDIPTEVIHKKTGILVDEKDIGGLAESITTFYKMNQQEFEEYSDNAKRHVLENFDVKQCAEDLVKHYWNELQ
ncbi:MAG: glycosyltransferase family 4 protein [Bacteroidota bacterium]